MGAVTLDAALKEKLNGLNEQITIRDEAGKPVGVYLPLGVYSKLMASQIEIPFTPEELERRRNEPGGMSLAEFWKRMGRE